MLDVDKNLKDSEQKSESLYWSNFKSLSLKVSYKKTEKLVAALYMVTDIIEKDEPMRLRLRTLGAGVISDINSTEAHTKTGMSLSGKVMEILSFLEIASAIGMISEMNRNILKKEFLELQSSLKEPKESLDFYSGHSTLSDFLQDDDIFTVTPPFVSSLSNRRSIGQMPPTRIGVQKGQTLMKALSDSMSGLSDKNIRITDIANSKLKSDNLKLIRRNEIISIIRQSIGDSTITDIKTKATGQVASFSEKTLQRELVALVHDGVLKKTGEKRWSRYSLK